MNRCILIEQLTTNRLVGFQYPFRYQDGIEKWCKENCQGKFNLIIDALVFELEQDAILTYVRFR